jgi:Xaa-Pro aminopeptidase
MIGIVSDVAPDVSSDVQPPLLSKVTRDYRYDLMMDLMSRQGLDGLAFTSGSFFQFATNFDTDVQTWERPIICVVPRNGRPFVVLNELSRNHWRFRMEAGRLWVNEARFYAEFPVNANRRLPEISEWAELVAECFRNSGLERGRVGLDSANLDRVARILPSVILVDASAQLRELRYSKHEEEIAVMREAGALSDWAQDRYRENIAPGRLLGELDASMKALICKEAARRFPGEDLQLCCWTLSGPSSAAPHGDGRSVGARIQRGDVIVNIVTPRLSGLLIENERTWFCGSPSSRQVQLFEAARLATEAACAAAIVGNPVCAMDQAARRVFERSGFADLVIHRTGHGMGIDCHEHPIDTAFNNRPLLAREVYSAEPGLYEWGLGGFRHDDTVVVRDVPEILTKAPKDLESQTIV